jgi:kynureninase
MTADRTAAEEMDRSDVLASFRDRFPIDDAGPIYMDGNSLGRPSWAVRDAIEQGMDVWQDRLVGAWSEWIDLPTAVGDRIGRLVGAAPGQMLACDSTSVNLYKLADAALAARPDRTVIVTDSNDFPTDRYVLAGLARHRSRQLRLIPSDPVDGVDPSQLASAVDRETALVALSHVNYRSAARLDLAEAAEIAHRHGALTLWDLSHSVGSVPVELDAAGADLAVGCSYKYLNGGPGAPAWLYVRHDLIPELRQPVWGWFGHRDQFEMGPRYEPADGITRFLTGSPPIFGLLAVRAGADLLVEAGIDRLWAKSQALLSLLETLVSEHLLPTGATLASPANPDRRGAHLAISHPEALPWCQALIERDLVVPDFRTPDVIRLGPAPIYTRFVDVFDAVSRMREVLASGLAVTGGSRPRVT